MGKIKSWNGIRLLSDDEHDEFLFLAEDACKVFKVGILRAMGLTINVKIIDKGSCIRSDSNCGTPVFNRDGLRALCLLSKSKEAGFIKMIMTPYDLRRAGLLLDELNR